MSLLISLLSRWVREASEPMPDPEPHTEEMLYNKRQNLQAELKKLHGSERKIKETEIQDLDAAIAKLKKKPKNDVLY
jgi:hypothetical protein